MITSFRECFYTSEAWHEEMEGYLVWDGSGDGELELQPSPPNSSGECMTSPSLYILLHHASVVLGDRLWLRSISLFAISLSPFSNLGLCGYEASFRQFHSRFFPDGRLSYSLMSLELEESIVCGKGKPEYGGGSHEKGFER